MRPLHLISFIAGMNCAAMVSADDSPYTAYVCVEQAEIVAGPGHRFYATDRLPRGMKVEIYREEPSGWLAIRPPEGSFSWVPAEFVERLEDKNLAKVKEPTGAYVGTSVEHVSEYQQQVTLKAGELVQVIAEKTAAASAGKERKWLKVAPPAGEYRWIHLRDVSRQQPEEPKPAEVEEEATERNGKALTPEPPLRGGYSVSQREREKEEPRRLGPIGSGIAIRAIDDRPVTLDRYVEPAQFRSAASSSDPRPLSPDGFVPRKRRAGDDSPVTSSGPIRSTTIPAARATIDPDARFASVSPMRQIPDAVVVSPSARPLSADEFSRQLDQIEVDLSLMVSQDRSQWNLPALRRRAEGLVESGSDPTARGRARLVLDKIKQFENAFEADGSPAKRSLAASGGEMKPFTSSLADPRYDAQGVLKPVVSRKGDTPAAPFAVVDADGQPVCFVTPSPGLNLNRYLNKQVGMYGRRGYLEELKKPHLVAERVIEMDSRLR
jgi:hypothetical protein